MILIVFCLCLVGYIAYLTFLSVKLEPFHIFVPFGIFIVTYMFYFSAYYITIGDTEWYGDYVLSAEHHEDWNEYIHKTCSKTVGSGDNKRTVTYDCSYVEYHPEYFCIKTFLGNEYKIDKTKYKNLKTRWVNQTQIGYHRGHTNDGYIYATKFNSQEKDMECLSVPHYYQNKVAQSDSVFKFKEITQKQAKSIGLYEYQTLSGYASRSVLGYTNCHELEVLNALYGSKYQCRVLFLVFKDKPKSIAFDQRDYWQNGNKNELVICIGTKNNKLDWCEVFSWSESDVFKVELRDKIMSDFGKSPDIKSYTSFLRSEIPKKWKRKEFEDFNYITINVSPYVTVCCTLFVFFCFIVLIGLDIKNAVELPSRRRYSTRNKF